MRSILYIGLIVLACAARAEDDVVIDSLRSDSTTSFVDRFPEAHVLDSLLFVHRTPPHWFTGNDSVNDEVFSARDWSAADDSLVLARMHLVPTVIDMTPHPDVADFVRFFVAHRRRHVARMRGMAEHYLPYFEEVLDRKDMPLELKYLPIIESALHPRARSRAGATGLWQIMSRTGRFLGLEINSLVDERSDVVASTEAATGYLKTLYGMYDDWLLALAAYNAGPGNINKAIARSGGQRDYWAIRPFLPRETRGYVPIFLGCVYAMHFADDYGIPVLRPQDELFIYDTVHVHQRLDLARVRDVLGIDSAALAFLNPSLRAEVIPATEDGYPLYLPVSHLAQFLAREDEILFDPSDTLPEPEVVEPAYYVYKVRPGDNLGFIAERFEVGVRELMDWNDLRSTIIDDGDHLVVYTEVEDPDAIANASNAASSPDRAIGVRREDMDPATCGCRYHVVEEGDTLWELAQAYGTTVDRIKQDNNITSHSNLKLGSILMIGR